MHHAPKHSKHHTAMHVARHGEDAGSTAARWLLPVLLVAQLMVILDITAVNIALPHIAADLKLSGSTISWTITSYSLIFGSLLLFGGRAADLLGRRRMFLTGLAVFTVSSLRLRDGRQRRQCSLPPAPVRDLAPPSSPRGTLDHHVLVPRNGSAGRPSPRGA